jgi:bifunctional ADP-heptose synthase (sugar kinase/adenylyltransferase)
MKLATLLDEHLPRTRLRELLDRFPDLRVGVMGDFFLDAYYDCAPELNELSLETGRNCYQVVRTRRQAGAAGTVAANLVALGVGRGLLR